MTSVICWICKDDFLPGLWAVADSRVSTSSSPLSDAVPKIFSLDVNCFSETDFLREHPRRILNPILAISGSTFIGLNTKEVLANHLGNLRECFFYDQPDLSSDSRTPQIKEIAELLRRIANRYLLSVGSIDPRMARCEMALVGFCKRSNGFKGFVLSNSPQDPSQMTLREHDFAVEKELILGDVKAEVRDEIRLAQSTANSGSLNFERAPITALARILRKENYQTIGGDIQLWACLYNGNKRLSITKAEAMLVPAIGMDINDHFEPIGGYVTDYSLGLTPPNEDGWPDAQRITLSGLDVEP